MFQYDATGTNISMHSGDTGAFKVKATRATGTDWTADDRMQMTVRNSNGTIVMQRWYRLDDDEGLGNGVVEIQFHNDDTDDWDAGSYAMERRYAVSPRWATGEAPEGACVDALTSGNEMIDGDVVRTVVQGSITIAGVYGKI
jgi:hypothetical protein